MSTKPYIKKLETIGDFVVWEVDGKYIRDNLNREFTNFGQHFAFPNVIPMYEFWIDKEYDPGEERYFVTHLLKEWQLMHDGMEYDTAIVVADKAEKKERSKSSLMSKLLKEVENNKDIPKELYIKKLKSYDCPIDIWVVNGEIVRDLYFIDFTEGGHHFVYPWVPFNEVWIDDDLSEKEIPYVLLHELHERFLMSSGLDYPKAHLSSSIVEYKCRKDPDKLISYIDRELKKNRSIT